MGNPSDPEPRQMIAARDATRDHLAAIHRGIREAAEAAVRRATPDLEMRPRGNTHWREADGAECYAGVVRLRDAERTAIGAIETRIERQQAAIRKRIAKTSRDETLSDGQG